VIRRGFWLVTGAVVGVAGYRKATRLARTLTGQGLLGGLAGTRGTAAIGRGATGRPAAGRPALQLPAEVPPGRAGQDGAQRGRPGKPEASRADRIAAAAARASAAAGFVRDVREGMAEYWDLHRGESDRRL
jgi:hypothetical protein